MKIIELVQNLTWNQKIAVLRTINRWSQEEAAEKCGTDKRIYWGWENGTNYPRLNSRKAIASAFKVSMEEIFPVTTQRRGA